MLLFATVAAGKFLTGKAQLPICRRMTRTAMSTAASVSSRPKNVLGTELQCCCLSPRTGFYRDGFCQTEEEDMGRHTVCALVTDKFLEFSKARGNDLITPMPAYSFPGLKKGDKWCLCVLRWKEALEADVAPKVFLEATHSKALEFVTMDVLKAHAAPPPSPTA